MTRCNPEPLDELEPVLVLGGKAISQQKFKDANISQLKFLTAASYL